MSAMPFFLRSSSTAAAADFDPEAVAVIAKALGHPARIRIVRLLLERQSCIGGDIVDDIGLAQSTVSEHLRILKEAGVIQGEIERPRVCYALRPEGLLPLAGLIDAVLDRTGETPACCADGVTLAVS